MSAQPPPDIALSWCPGCGRMGILVHAMEAFKTRNVCAFCPRGVTVQVALYKFDRLGAELSGHMLTQGSAPPKPQAARVEQAAKSPVPTHRIAALPEVEPEEDHGEDEEYGEEDD